MDKKKGAPYKGVRVTLEVDNYERTLFALGEYLRKAPLGLYHIPGLGSIKKYTREQPTQARTFIGTEEPLIQTLYSFKMTRKSLLDGFRKRFAPEEEPCIESTQPLNEE